MKRPLLLGMLLALVIVQPNFGGLVSNGEGAIHIFAIGVDDYQGHDLRFAKADASEFARAIANLTGSTHHPIFTRLLLDAAASKERVEAAMMEAAASVQPNDTFVLFFAGMSYEEKAMDASDEDGFLLLHGADAMSFQPEKALSGRALKSWFRKLQAKNKILVLDSCYGEFFLSEEHAAAELEGGEDVAAAAETNVLVLGTSGLALEDPELRHGVLTAVLLEGIAGSADFDGDRAISAEELRASLYSGLARREKKSRMRPGSSFLGDNFTLGRLSPVARPDSTPPNLTLREPGSGEGSELTLPPGLVRVVGSVEDDSKVSALTINGAPFDVNRDGSFSAVVPLEIGRNAVEVVAIDEHGNATSKSLSLVGTAASPDTTRGVKAMSGQAVKEIQEWDGRSYALLIATDVYDSWTTLQNPILDAETIGSLLHNTYGFEVEILRDPTRAEVLTKLQDYQQKSYKAADQLLLFIAGHGQYSEYFDDGFLVTRDSPATVEPQTDGNFLPHGALFKIINKIPCEHILLVLDACFSGQLWDAAPPAFRANAVWRSELRVASLNPSRIFERSTFAIPPLILGQTLYADVSDFEFIDRKLKGKTRRLFTSGGKVYVPDGDPGEHSPFAARFIEALESKGVNDRILTTDEIYSFLERAKPEPRRGLFTADGAADFVFVAQQVASGEGELR